MKISDALHMTTCADRCVQSHSCFSNEEIHVNIESSNWEARRRHFLLFWGAAVSIFKT